MYRKNMVLHDDTKHKLFRVLLTMKLSLLLLLFTFMQVYAEANAQEVSIRVKNAPLQSVFKLLKKQTGYDFLYASEDLNQAAAVTLDVKDKQLISVIEACLKNQPLDYEIQNTTVLIRKKKSQSNAPVPFQREILGRVTNNEGQPIEGVTVNLKNTTLATTTDADGRYRITPPQYVGILVFTAVGYEPTEAVIGTTQTIDVTLIEQVSDIDEVVIVGYGTQKKESVVGAISTVNVKSLKSAVPRSLNNALAGQVAGVIAVQRSGEPGNDDAQFWIRGISTFGAGSDPLVLVDGVERPINNIEPEDIETFSVLKDAAATAIYGIRGANGVILVNTRRGASQAPSINFKYETMLKGATRWPEYTDGATFMELYNEAYLATNPESQPYFSQDRIDKTRSGEDPLLYPDVNWLDLMTKKHTLSNRANLNVTGGGEVAKYYISGSLLNEQGMWKEDNLNAYHTNTNLNRYNFRANTDVKLGAYTDVGLNLGGYLVTVNYPGTSSDNLWELISKTNGITFPAWYPDPNNSDNKLFAGTGSVVRNPYHDLVNRGFQTTWNSSIQSNVNARHDLSYLLKGLSVQGLFSFDAYNWHNIERTRDMGDLYIARGRDDNNELMLQQTVVGIQDLGFSKGAGGNRRIYFQANLNYTQQFGDHSLAGLLLYNQQDFVNADASNSISALPFRLQGYVGRLSYNFKNRYYLEASAGYNGSENFAEGHRFGLFPAVALGWILSEEPFYKAGRFSDALEYLKIRGSIGEKGNDQIGGRRFAYLTTVGGGNGGWTFGRDYTVTIPGRGEEEWGANLTWEREREVNAGIEARFLHGFYLQADFFRRERRNIFLQRNSLPAIFGVKENPWGNIGIMENQGVDASLEYRSQFGKLDLTFRGNFTYAKNRIIENDQPTPIWAYRAEKGKRLGQPFGLIAEGLFTTADFADPQEGVLLPNIPAHTFGKVSPGDIRYRDVNGDGIVNIDDYVAIGNPVNPSIIYGFGMSLGYANFDLSVFFQGSGMMDFMLFGGGWYPFMDGLNGNLQVHGLDRWTPENPSQDVLFPNLGFSGMTNNVQPSTWWQRDASYLRLRTAELGYTLPKKLSQKLKIDAFRVFLSGFNLLTFSKFTFWDPELGAGSSGNTGAKYPIQRTFNLGINANF